MIAVFKKHAGVLMTVIFTTTLISVSLAVVYFVFIENFLAAGGMRESLVASDYAAFLTGGRMVAMGMGNRLYDLETQAITQQLVVQPYEWEYFLPFIALPVVGAFFIPFTFVPFYLGYVSYAVVNLFLVVLITLYLGKLFAGVKRYRFWYLLPLGFMPTALVVVLGQISLFVVLILLIVYSLIKNGRDKLAGIILSLILIKVQYILIVPFIVLLSGKKIYTSVAFGAGAALLMSISIVIVGKGFLVEYLSFLEVTNTQSYGNDFRDMFSLYALLKLYLGDVISEQYLYFINLAAYLLALVLFYLRSRNLKRESYNALFMAAVFFMMVFSIHVLIQDLVFSLIFFFALFGGLVHNKVSTKWGHLLLFGLYLMPVLMPFDASPYASVFLLLLGLVLIGPRNRVKGYLVRHI